MIKDIDKLDFSREISAIRKGKVLYIVSFSLAVALAIFYAIFSSPVYHNEAVIMIEKEGGNSGLSNLLSGGSGVANLFSLTGLGSSSIDDELVILRSHDCYKNAISNLGVNRIYQERVGLRKTSLYGKSPVLVEASKVFFDTLSSSLMLEIYLTGNSSAKVTLSSGFMGMNTLAECPNQSLPFLFETPFGTFHFLKTEFYTDEKQQIGRKINVQLVRNDFAAESLQKILSMKEVDKKSNAIELDFDIQDPDYGRDMIGSIISSYRMMRRQHKAEQSAAKIKFLDKRIELLTNQLDTTENSVRDYMRQNQIVDVDAQTEILLNKTTIVRDSIFALKTQQTIHEAILQILRDPSNKYQLLAKDARNPLVNSYNELILERVKMVQSAKPENVMLQNLESRILEMRNIVIDNSLQTIEQNKMIINSLSKKVGNEAQLLGSMPAYKFEMLNNQRDLQLQNNLLIYLLQERENALLSLNSEEETGFVVDKPYTAKKTVKKKIYLVAFLLLASALCLPTFWLLFRIPRRKEETA